MRFENRLKLQRGIPLTLSIENVNKEFWKCEDESIRWGYITDEHRKAITLLSHGEIEKKSRLKRTVKERIQFNNKNPGELESNLCCGLTVIFLPHKLSKTSK